MLVSHAIGGKARANGYRLLTDCNVLVSHAIGGKARADVRRLLTDCNALVSQAIGGKAWPMVTGFLRIAMC